MARAETPKQGRPPVSSAEEVQRQAMRLFLEQGFDRTSMTDVAAAAGIGRTTLFRYFRSKGDIVLAPFDEHLRRLARRLATQPRDLPVMTAVHSAVVDAFAEAVDDQDVWLQRFQVLQQTGALAADVAVRWLTWADTVGRYVALRTGKEADHPGPAAVGGAMQAAFAATLRTWLRTPGLHGDVALLMAESLRPVTEALTPLTRH